MECLDQCEDGHYPGDTWEAEDGCNTCECTEALEIACTLMECLDQCEDGHVPGESWEAGDGCNVCTCTEELLIMCTTLACPEICGELEAQYEALVTDNTACEKDADCQALQGQCGVGLGGCWELVNQTIKQDDLVSLGQKFSQAGCTQWMCKCMLPPVPACVEGVCSVKPDTEGKWAKIEGVFTREGGFFYQFVKYQLKDKVLFVSKSPEAEPCEVPVTEQDLAPILAAAEPVDWPGVKPSYKSPDNPFCCCDQFVYTLALVLTAKDGAVTNVSTNWCDESLFGGLMPEALVTFFESFVALGAVAEANCK
jgi:hypothetical protein